MNPIIWYVTAAAMLSASCTFVYWLNPFPWTGPQIPIERNAPLEDDDGRPD